MNESEDIREFYQKIEIFEFALELNTSIGILDIRLGNIVRIVNNMMYLFNNGQDIQNEYMQCAKSIKTTEYAIGAQHILQEDDVEFVRTILDELKVLLYRFVKHSSDDEDRTVLLSRMREVRYYIILLVNRFKDRYNRNHCSIELD